MGESIGSKGEYYDATMPDTLDLSERAKLGLNHLTEMIEEKFDYEMYFMANFDCNPPIAAVHLTALSCCQCKALEVMAMLRVMSGSKQNLDREAKMVEMMTSLLGEDGLYWIPIRDDKPWLGKGIGAKEPYTSIPGNGRMLYVMRIWYQYTGDNAWKNRLNRMVDGLHRLAIHKEDHAYFPIHGMGEAEYVASLYTKSSGWRDTEEPKNEKEGEEGSLFNHQGMMPGALANWYILSGNEKALRLSGELVRFLIKPQFWGGLKDYPGVAGREHAHWYGHFHGHINTLLWFDNSYLRFKEIKEKDVFIIEFPMVETTEEYTITVPVQFAPNWNNVVEKSTVHTFKFKGNTLIEISPPLPSLPPVLPITQLYKNRGHYWGNKAPMKKVIRYVSPVVIRW